MFGKYFELNEATLHIVEEIGRHMPGGFFIYRAKGDGELLYANRAVLNIYGCETLAEFRALTGYTFRGMVYPDDYERVSGSVPEQIRSSGDAMDFVEYRIIRKDGTVRWVDDYGHYTETEAYGGIFYVFLSDITEKRERRESDLAVRQAVIEALSECYHTVWLIDDVETESFSLYRGDLTGITAHALPNRDALQHMKYSRAKEFYISTTVAPSDQARLQEELALPNLVARLKEKPQFNINYLRAMPDGTERYFRIEFARMVMPGGKMGVVCGFKDVDDDVREGQRVQKALQDAKRAEEENRRLTEEVESAARIADMMGSVASLLSNMPAMSFSKDASTGRYLACNQAFAEYAHKESPEGVIGLTDHDIFDRETADHFVEDDKKALSMEEPYIFFEDVPDAGGKTIRNLQTTKMRFTDSAGRLCTLGMCVDVTEMTRIKTAEARRQELEEKVRLQEELIEQQEQAAQQSQMITAMASDYRCVYYVVLDTDEGICYRTDHSGEEALEVGDRFLFSSYFTAYAEKYVTEPYREGFLRFIEPETIRERLSKELMITYRYLSVRNGEETYEKLRMAGVRRPEDREDHLVHAIGVGFTDIDLEMRDSMAKNETLSAALKAAENANRAKTAFLSNMSHEIRTPMNAIIGLDNIALNNPDISQETRRQLEKIGDSARHLLGIINDILDMSRIESGRMTINAAAFSLAKTLEQVNTMIGGQCRDKGLAYECSIPGTLEEWYIGDDMKLRQVMINILGNAVKFTPEGGKITFTVEETARFDGKATIRFTFSDTGIGMSREYLPRIFDAFSQEDSSTTSRYGSTGLGMPITKSIVELMNGNISVESEKGKGTIFTVVLTLSLADRGEEEGEGAVLHPEDMSVLVIDDDPVACTHAKLVLNQLGIGCDTAGSGEEGLRKVKLHHARNVPYNLILVDWKMPEMDGVETTKKIRDAVGHDSAIIILTAYNWDEIREEAMAAGVDTFVSKPLFAGSVLDQFREAFRKKRTVSPRKKADLRGRRVLLAEDVEVNAEIMMMILSMREMEADHAENGLEAVRMFEEHAPGYYDAVLMDMRMPVMDGLEATKRIRAMKREDASAVPIIALTANAFDEDVQRSMQAGLNAHLSKPVDPENLFSTLENLIQ